VFAKRKEKPERNDVMATQRQGKAALVKKAHPAIIPSTTNPLINAETAKLNWGWGEVVVPIRENVGSARPLMAQ